MAQDKLTQARLKELLNYDPESGDFVWLKRRGIAGKGRIAGCLYTTGYIYIALDRKKYNASRLAHLYMEGYFPESEMDHKDRDRANNKWDNLRHTSHQCNMRNKPVSKNNTSGITGVVWCSDLIKWHAQIMINKTNKNLGYFIDKTEAVRARWEAEVLHNFPNCNTTSSALKYLEANIR